MQYYWYLTFVCLVHLTQSKRPWTKLLMPYFCTFCTFDTEQKIISKISDILLLKVCIFDTSQKIISKINDFLRLSGLYIWHRTQFPEKFTYILLLYVLYIWHRAKDHEKINDIVLLCVLYIWHWAKDHVQNCWYLTFVSLVHLTQSKRSWAKLVISYFWKSCAFDTS